MPAFTRFGSFRLPAMLSLLLSVNCQMIWWATPVQAQSLLQQLFGFSPGPQVQSAPRMSPPRPLTGGTPLRLDLPSSPQRWSSGAGSAPAEGNGSYTTVCVRMCDGYYFPISHRAPRGRFYHDAEACRSRCGASDAQLFYFSSSGGDMKSAVDLTGRSYARLPIAFLHRKKLVSGCACKPEPWSQAALIRHERYALAEGRTPAGGAGGTGQLAVVAGNYAAPAPYHGGQSAKVIAEEATASATLPDTTASAVGDGDRSAPALTAEAGTDNSSSTPTAEASPSPRVTARRGNGRNGSPGRHAAARQPPASGASGSRPRKPGNVAMASSGGKYVWPGDAPSRTR